MHLKHLPSQDLHVLAKELAQKERELRAKALKIYTEIEKRKLYSKYKYESLYQYSVQFLNESESVSYQMSRAAKYCEEIDDIPKKIADGSLNLTTIIKLDNHCRKNKINDWEERASLLAQLQGLSGKDCEILLKSKEERGAPPIDSIHLLSKDYKRLHITLTGETAEKMRQIKNLLYQKGRGNFDNILSFMAETTIEKVSRLNKKAASKTSSEKHDRYIAEGIRNAVWQRAKGRCENCKSEMALEIDHIIPYAKGGTNDLWNLRLLCRNCNQREMIEGFGNSKRQKIAIKNTKEHQENIFPTKNAP